MTSRNIVLAAVLAFSTFGCADVGIDDGDDNGDDGPFREVCPDLRRVCTGDTVCMGASCEDAFDRDYKVWLNVTGPGPKPCGDDPGPCPRQPVEVYYSGLEDPILTSADPKMAEIHVMPGSSLIAEHRGDQCVIDLTAERLQIGSGTCSAGGLTATLKLNPMPSDGDEAAF